MSISSFGNCSSWRVHRTNQNINWHRLLLRAGFLEAFVGFGCSTWSTRHCWSMTSTTNNHVPSPSTSPVQINLNRHNPLVSSNKFQRGYIRRSLREIDTILSFVFGQREIPWGHRCPASKVEVVRHEAAFFYTRCCFFAFQDYIA